MEVLLWLRVIGDTLFAAGMVAFVVAVARMTLGRTAAVAAPATAARTDTP